jgi:hypothetical protein
MSVHRHRRLPKVEGLESRSLLAVGGLPIHAAITAAQVPIGLPGPQVLNVQRYGFHNLRTVIVVTFNTFSQGLDPTTAQDVNNYTLTPLNGGATPRVILALYRPADANFHDQVTLFLNRPISLFRTFQFTINGSTPTGVSNPSGVLLDGAGNGTPGTNFVFDLKGFGQVATTNPTTPPTTAAAIHPTVVVKGPLHLARHHG